MTTNIAAILVTLLVTNVAETISHEPTYIWNYGALPAVVDPFFPAPAQSRQTKSVRTDVNEMRLLILEVEGQKFTNTLSSVLKWRGDEWYVQEQPPAPAPVWVLKPERSEVRTNFDTKPFIVTNGIMGGLTLTNKSILYIREPDSKSAPMMTDEDGNVWQFKKGKWVEFVPVKTNHPPDKLP